MTHMYFCYVLKIFFLPKLLATPVMLAMLGLM